MKLFFEIGPSGAVDTILPKTIGCKDKFFSITNPWLPIPMEDGEIKNQAKGVQLRGREENKP